VVAPAPSRSTSVSLTERSAVAGLSPAQTAQHSECNGQTLPCVVETGDLSMPGMTGVSCVRDRGVKWFETVPSRRNERGVASRTTPWYPSRGAPRIPRMRIDFWDLENEKAEIRKHYGCLARSLT
jgi:hypothetical protein